MRLHVFNSDVLPHTCLAGAYYMAVLKEPRPDERIRPLKEMEKLRLLYEVFPEKRDVLKRKLEELAEEFTESFRPATIMEVEE